MGILKRAAVWTSTCSLGAALFGCVTNGDDFRSDTGWIKEGQTKQTDVKMILGDPGSVGNSGGRPTWTYGFYRYRLFGKSHQKELKLYWRNDGTIETYSFNSSFPEDVNVKPAAQNPKPEY